VFLIEEYVNRNQSILDRLSRFYITIIFLLIGLSIVLYTDVLKPMYYWWYGLQSGRYTIARITTIAPRKLRWGDTFEGHWQFVIDTTIYATPFLVSNFQSGSWVMRLAVGSAVHVLLHPTKPTVLVAIGIVNEASPMLIPPTESALLAELLARRSSDDSTSVVD
jgi:hypothetical protein